MKVILINRKKTLIILSVCLAFIVTVIATFSTNAYSVVSNVSKRKLPIYSVNTDEKKLAISFDCAWGVDYTDNLIECMQSKGVKATFFMVEFWAKKYPEYVKKISDCGFEIGTHSATHPKMSKLSKNDILKELNDSIKTIENITEGKVSLFRPPFGDYNDTLIEVAESLNLYTIQWSVDSLDWKNLDSNEIYNRVVKSVKNGSIVLFHNQGLHTLEALPKIIDKLQGEGYTFVTIGELIYKDNFKILADGSQSKL